MGDELFLFRHQLHNVFTRIRHFAESCIEGNYLACQSRNFVDIGCTGDPQQSSKHMLSVRWISRYTAVYIMCFLHLEQVCSGGIVVSMFCCHARGQEFDPPVRPDVFFFQLLMDWHYFTKLPCALCKRDNAFIFRKDKAIVTILPHIRVSSTFMCPKKSDWSRRRTCTDGRIQCFWSRNLMLLKSSFS